MKSYEWCKNALHDVEKAYGTQLELSLRTGIPITMIEFAKYSAKWHMLKEILDEPVRQILVD